MRKRKPLLPVDDKSKKRTVRFDRNVASQSQSRRGILPYNPQKNSDDEFSMASWEQRALASSKTPKMNNLTISSSSAAAGEAAAAAAAARTTAKGINGKTGVHGGAGPRKLPTKSRTVPTATLRRIPENHNMDIQQSYIEKTYTDGEKTNARKFPEEQKQSNLKSHTATQLRQSHQVLPPQQQTKEDRSQDMTKTSNSGNKEATHYHLSKNKVSIRPSSSRSKSHKDDIPTLTPRRRTRSDAILPADDHATKHPTATTKTTSVRDRTIVGSKIDSINRLSFKQNVKSDVDDMDCDSSGGSCLESTSSSSSEASSLTSTNIDTDGAQIHDKKDTNTRRGKFHRQEVNGITQKHKSTDRPRGKDYHPPHQIVSTLSVPVASTNQASTSKSTRFFDDERHDRARKSRPDNNAFFQKMMNSETPVTAKRNTELLGSTVGADGHFVLHDDDSDITSLSRASKTPKRKLFPYPSSVKKKNVDNLGDDTTPPLIDNLPFVAHHEDNRKLHDGKDIDEESIEAWSVDGNTTLPFEFTVDGKHYAHPALPPGWKMRLSRTHKKPVYIHPDHGRTWYCPVVLPHHSMNMVYARSNLRSIDNVEEGATELQNRTHTEPSSTPPSPPSSAVSKKESHGAGKHLSRTNEASARKERMMSTSVLENIPNPPVRLANQTVNTVKAKKKTPPSVLEKSPRSHQKRSKTPSSFQSRLRESSNKTPISNHGNILSPKPPFEDAPSNHNSPGTMSDLLRSYENEKIGATSGEVLSSSKESGALSGYECDDPGETESSSSLSSRKDSKDPTLRCISTPRRHDKLLPSKLYQSRSEEQKLSPIDEAPEKPTDDATELTEVPTPAGIKGNEHLSDQHADVVDNPLETPNIHGVEKKPNPSRSETSSKSHTTSTHSMYQKDTGRNVSSSFRTPKSHSASKNAESGGKHGSGQIVEVAVLRHGSSRRKKRQTPLLSSAGSRSGDKKSSDHRSIAGSIGEKLDRKSPHSPFISTNEDWSPLSDQRNSLSTQKLVHCHEKADYEKSPNSNNDDSVVARPEDSASVNTPNSKDLQSNSPNVSGVPPGSVDALSVHSPLRSDIQTPAIAILNRHKEESSRKDPKDSQVKPTPAAGVEHSLKKSDVEKDQDQIPAEEQETEEGNIEDTKEVAATAPESPVVFDTYGDDFSEGPTGTPSHIGSKSPAEKKTPTDTREAAAMEPESPVVFDTYGDEFSEGSTETPHQSTPKSSEEKMLSSSRSIPSANKPTASLGTPSLNVHVDPDEKNILSSENENDGTDISVRSFEIEESKSTYAESSFIHEKSSGRNHRSGRSKFGWRVLHPPHPICCLQRLDEILSNSRKTKATKKRAKKAKKKPRKSYGAKRTAD